MSERDTDQLLRDGIAAARAGHRDEAKDLLLQVIEQDQEVAAAWLWLSGVVDDPEERRICLENVLTLNPDNRVARNGLRWLDEQEPAPPLDTPAPPAPEPPAAPRVTLTPAPKAPDTIAVKPPPVSFELDPYGCPYCGGSVSGEGARCDNCQRSVAVRYRKSERDTGVGWLVACFLLLGFVSGLEGYYISQLIEVNQLPEILTQSALAWMVGGALFSPEGAGELADFGGTVTFINYVLAGLCVVTAVGLALKVRPVYFASFVLVGVIVIVIVAGLLTQLTGWLPAIFRLGLVALTVKFLVDSSPAFEFLHRTYNADVDQGIETDMDYHNRAQQYYEQGMWAKAAAHWKVAAQLAPGQVQYRARLANAYLRMGYPEAALGEVDKVLVRTPDDKELRAFRDSLAQLEARD